MHVQSPPCEGRGTGRKHGGGGIGDGRYFAGRTDDNGAYDRNEEAVSGVSVAVSQEGVNVYPSRYSVLSGPHAPTTHAAHGSPRPCRADWASGLAGTLYEYTSIL